MKKANFYKTKLTICLTFFILAFVFQNSSSQTFCIQDSSDQIEGEQDGFRYELWNQDSQGTACMTLGSGALFSGEWSGIENYLARRGLSYDQTQEHEEIGTFYTTYNCTYNPSTGSSGNSYLSVYGWTVNPLIEFYIIEDWRNWIPSMAIDAILKDSIYVNGSYYDIYENTRVDQPSIVGNTTFQQYFSIRRNVRTSGTINISEHFDTWETLGMEMGKMHEVSFVIEGYQNSGSFEFTELNVFADDQPVQAEEGTNTPKYFSIYPNPNSGDVSLKFDQSVLNARLEILNLRGELLVGQNICTGQKEIPIKDLSAGNYIVKISGDGLLLSKMLMVK